MATKTTARVAQCSEQVRIHFFNVGTRDWAYIFAYFWRTPHYIRNYRNYRRVYVALNEVSERDCLAAARTVVCATVFHYSLRPEIVPWSPTTPVRVWWHGWVSPGRSKKQDSDWEELWFVRFSKWLVWYCDVAYRISLVLNCRSHYKTVALFVSPYCDRSMI